MNKKIIIGSRGSDLALWQARHVASLLSHPSEIKIIKTQGDQLQNLSFDKLAGKGFFTKELEAALLAETIDLAVHSYKDLPIENAQGLVVAACLERGPVRDTLVLKEQVANLPLGIKKNALVGTSSLRRKAQIKTLRPDLELRDLRGNVPTRVKKVIEGNLDAIIVAEAGLLRLNLFETMEKQGIHKQILTIEQMTPAPAQGALAIQIREQDTKTKSLVAAFHNEPTHTAVTTERALLARFGGGCHIPLGTYCEYIQNTFYLRACIATDDDRSIIRTEIQADNQDLVVEMAYLQLMKKVK